MTIQIRVCQACYFAYPRAGNKACPSCGHVYQTQPKVAASTRLPALPWRIVTSSVRAFNNAGRFFTATYHPKKGWRLKEYDADLHAVGHANPLRVWLQMYSAKELSDVIRSIFGPEPNAEPSVSFEIWQNQIIHKAVESLAKAGQ